MVETRKCPQAPVVLYTNGALQPLLPQYASVLVNEAVEFATCPASVRCTLWLAFW